MLFSICGKFHASPHVSYVWLKFCGSPPVEDFIGMLKRIPSSLKSQVSLDGQEFGIGVARNRSTAVGFLYFRVFSERLKRKFLNSVTFMIYLRDVLHCPPHGVNIKLVWYWLCHFVVLDPSSFADRRRLLLLSQGQG